MPSKGTPKIKSGGRHAGAGHAPQPGVASLRDKAYDAIKHRIITLAFRPGEYINELQLSAFLKIGRTPVHQALDRLMMEGMVEVIPRKGVIVKPVSLNEVLQIIEVRLINEPFGARLAAEQANDMDLADLAEVLKRTRDWAALRNVENMMLLDREFHLLIARAAKNDVLIELLRNLHERSLRFWFISLGDDLQLRRVDEEHREILDAIARRDAAGAADAMRHHIESSRKHITRAI